MRSKRITRVEFPARTISPKQPPPTKRVAAYARVSTMKDAQENSFQSQQEYFIRFSVNMICGLITIPPLYRM